MRNLEDRIRKALRETAIKKITDNELIQSAILIPIFKNEGKYSLLFTKRPRTLKRHAGQVAFPGGIYEECDNDIEKTAIRETCEELGIKDENIKVLGRMDDMMTSTGYIISPFVGTIDSYNKIKINSEEIEELKMIPLFDLMNISPRVEMRAFKQSPYPVYYYDYKNWVIWGATGKILKKFLEIISRI